MPKWSFLQKHAFHFINPYFIKDVPKSSFTLLAITAVMENLCAFRFQFLSYARLILHFLLFIMWSLPIKPPMDTWIEFNHHFLFAPTIHLVRAHQNLTVTDSLVFVSWAKSSLDRYQVINLQECSYP